MKRTLICSAAGAFYFFSTSAALAGVVYSTSPDGPSFDPNPAITTTFPFSPQTSATVNQQASGGTSLSQTFRTGATGFRLDRIQIYSGGKGGGTARLNIYPDPVGGEETDGSVNTSFSNDLLNGGNGVQFAFNGSPGLQYVSLDLTGADEVYLYPNQQYAIEFDVLSGQYSWQRSTAGIYSDGNLYQGTTEGGFNGPPPANNRGERLQVGATPQRDGAVAIYAADPIQGDYNANGRVDAADYVLWRKGGPLLFEVFEPGVVNAADYDAWRARFNNLFGTGAGQDEATVPEASAILTLLTALVTVPAVGQRRR